MIHFRAWPIRCSFTYKENSSWNVTFLFHRIKSCVGWVNDSIFMCRWTIALSEVFSNSLTHFTHSWQFRQNFIFLSLQKWNILLECSDSQGSRLSDWLMCVTLHEMSLLFPAHPSLQQPWSELVILSYNSVQHAARKRIHATAKRPLL